MTDVRTHLGEQVKPFVQTNGWKLKPSRTDSSPFIYPDQDGSTEVFRFVYDDPAGSFTLPSARLIWIRQYAGLIYDITVDTSEQKGSLESVYGQLQELQATLLRSGWKAQASLPPVAEVRQAVLASQGTTTGFGTAKYVRGTAVATLMLSTPGAVIEGKQIQNVAFVAELNLSDDALGDRASKMCFDARRKERGNADELLPLSYWLDRQ